MEGSSEAVDPQAVRGGGTTPDVAYATFGGIEMSPSFGQME
jgi:hypothetical protein